MIPERLKTRLKKDRAMTAVTLRIPEDVVASLKSIAPHKGFTSFQALLKFYISEALRRDEALLVFGPMARLAEAMKRGREID